MNTNPQKPLFFVLGAPDHEMQEIRRICKERGLAHAHATLGGAVVRSHEAYLARGVQGLLPKEPVTLVFVECSVSGLPCHEIIDHHQEGDPGYGKEPHEYLQGSSLGQFLQMLGLEPTPRQLLIAAADHCLTAAYQGLCPGVDPLELKAWREETRSRARGLSLSVLRSQIGKAEQALYSAPRVRMNDVDVAWFESAPPPEVSEASARLAMPYAYVKQQDDGRVKSGIRSAPANVIQYWMERCGLKSTYGDPQRGFAGGYF